MPADRLRVWAPEVSASVHTSLAVAAAIAHTRPGQTVVLVDGEPQEPGPAGREGLAQVFTASCSPSRLDGTHAAALGLVSSKIAVNVGGETVPLLILDAQVDGEALADDLAGGDLFCRHGPATWG